MLLKSTRELVKKFGPSIVQGSLTPQQLGELCQSFRNVGGYKAPGVPYTDQLHTKQEALHDFVEYIGPFLSDEELYCFNQLLMQVEIEQNAGQTFRNETLPAAFFRYEARRHGLAVGKYLELQTTQQPSQLLLRLKIPAAIKAHYQNFIIPHLDTENRQTVATHFIFNVFQALVVQDINNHIKDPQQIIALQSKLGALRTGMESESIGMIYSLLTDSSEQVQFSPSRNKEQRVQKMLEFDVPALSDASDMAVSGPVLQTNSSSGIADEVARGRLLALKEEFILPSLRALQDSDVPKMDATRITLFLIALVQSLNQSSQKEAKNDYFLQKIMLAISTIEYALAPPQSKTDKRKSQLWQGSQSSSASAAEPSILTPIGKPGSGNSRN